MVDLINDAVNFELLQKRSNGIRYAGFKDFNIKSKTYINNSEFKPVENNISVEYYEKCYVRCDPKQRCSIVISDNLKIARLKTILKEICKKHNLVKQNQNIFITDTNQQKKKSMFMLLFGFIVHVSYKYN